MLIRIVSIKNLFLSRDFIDRHVRAEIINKPFTVIPNAVNIKNFTINKNEAPVFAGINFIAITGNTYHKNTDGVIRSVALFIKNGFEAILHIIGPNTIALKY